MAEAVQAYPLSWPAGKARTEEPQTSRFGTNSWSTNKRISLNRAVDELLSELSLLGAINEIISSNLKLRIDGRPYSNQRTPDDPGIAVYFDLPNDQGTPRAVCMACDRWAKQSCNVWSIAKCVNALRGLDRWGGGDMVQAAFTGFIALPGPGAEPWWSVLGFYNEAEAMFQGDFEIKAKKMLQKAHPDKPGGDEWTFKKIIKALEKGREIRKANG